MHLSFRTHVALAILAACAFFPSVSKAQTLDSYGLKAGVTASRFSSNMWTDDMERRVGVDVLVFAEWLPRGPFSVVTEAGYVQRGYATVSACVDEVGQSCGTLRMKDRFDYGSLAVLAKLRHRDGQFVPYALAGPRVDLLIGGDPSNGLAKYLQRFAGGWIVGVGAAIEDVLPVSVLVEVRYNRDLTNSLAGSPRTAYHNAFDLLLGITL